MKCDPTEGKELDWGTRTGILLRMPRLLLRLQGELWDGAIRTRPEGMEGDWQTRSI